MTYSQWNISWLCINIHKVKIKHVFNEREEHLKQLTGRRCIWNNTWGTSWVLVAKLVLRDLTLRTSPAWITNKLLQGEITTYRMLRNISRTLIDPSQSNSRFNEDTSSRVYFPPPLSLYFYHWFNYQSLLASVLNKISWLVNTNILFVQSFLNNRRLSVSMVAVVQWLWIHCVHHFRSVESIRKNWKCLFGRKQDSDLRFWYNFCEGIADQNW